MNTLLLASLLVSGPPSCCQPSMTDFLSDPAFMAAHLAPKPFHFVAKDGETMTYNDAAGNPTTGFVVKPNKGVKTAIILVHEWWGLNGYIKATAEKIHDQTGFGVLAVDLYDGQVGDTPEAAGKLMAAVKSERATHIVRGAVDALTGGKFGFKAEKIGTIGFCFGGGWSHRAAIEGGKEVQACVMFYGMPDTEAADLQRLHAPVLMIWADEDKWINKDVVDKFKTAMTEAHRSLKVEDFHANHGFANPSNPIYDKTAADKAMADAIAFLKDKLSD